MQAFQAQVKNGKLTLNEPCDLPEGQVVVLLPLEELLTMTDDAGEEGVSFEVFQPPARQWKKPKALDAAALIDELRSL